MSEKIDCIAFHEAGHAVAHVLAGIPFKFVTIKADEEKDEQGFKSLGQVVLNEPASGEEWDQYSILNPDEFNIFFKDDFTKLAGLVADKIYRGRFNYKSSKENFRQWVGTSLNKLPESLSSKYVSFILEYTYHT